MPVIGFFAPVDQAERASRDGVDGDGSRYTEVTTLPSIPEGPTMILMS